MDTDWSLIISVIALVSYLWQQPYYAWLLWHNRRLPEKARAAHHPLSESIRGEASTQSLGLAIK